MQCAELENLRAVAIHIKHEIAAQRAKRKGARVLDRREFMRGAGDMETFLTRKLQRAAALIESHISTHKCQD